MEVLISFHTHHYCYVDGESLPEAKTYLSEPQDSVAWREQEEERAAVHEKCWAGLQDPSWGEVSLEGKNSWINCRTIIGSCSVTLGPDGNDCVLQLTVISVACQLCGSPCDKIPQSFSLCFVYCKRSKIGGVEGLGRRLVQPSLLVAEGSV